MSPLHRGIYLLPSLFTTGNLFAGYYAVVATLQGEYRLAAIALGIAMILDGLDGRIARMTDSQSEFGKAYDSLADVITFGLAPAVLVFSWALWDLGRVGWLASFFYAVCAAMRLARFSLQHGPSDRRWFIGLATPPSAGLLAALAFYWPERVDSLLLSRLALVLVLGLSLLMISRIRYRSFKDIDLRRPQPQTIVLLLAAAIALIALDPENILLLAAVIYVVSGPTESVLGWLRRRLRTGRKGTDEADARAPGGDAH